MNSRSSYSLSDNESSDSMQRQSRAVSRRSSTNLTPTRKHLMETRKQARYSSASPKCEKRSTRESSHLMLTRKKSRSLEKEPEVLLEREAVMSKGALPKIDENPEYEALSNRSSSKKETSGHQMQTRKKARERTDLKKENKRAPKKLIAQVDTSRDSIIDTSKLITPIDISENLLMDIEDEDILEQQEFGIKNPEATEYQALPQIDESAEYEITASEKISIYNDFVSGCPKVDDKPAEMNVLDGVDLSKNEILIEDKLKNAFCNLVKVCNEADALKCYSFDDSKLKINDSLKVGCVRVDELSEEFIKTLGACLKRERPDIVLMQHCAISMEAREMFGKCCWPYKLYWKKGKINFANGVLLASKWRLIGSVMDENGRIVLMRLNSPQFTMNMVNIDVAETNVRLVKQFISKNLEYFMGDEILLLGGYFGVTRVNRADGGLELFLKRHEYMDCTDFMKDEKSRKWEKKRFLLRKEWADKFLKPEVSSVKIDTVFMSVVKLQRKIGEDKFESYVKVQLNAGLKEKYVEEKEAEFLKLDKERKHNLDVNTKGLSIDPRYNTRTEVEAEKEARETTLVDAFGNKVHTVPGTYKCGECGYNEGKSKLASHYGKFHSPLVCFSCENHSFECKGSANMIKHMQTEHFNKWGNHCKFCVMENNKKPKLLSGWTSYIYYFDHMKNSHSEIYKCLVDCKIGTENEMWDNEAARSQHRSLAHLIDSKELNNALYEVWNLDLRNLCLRCGSKNYFNEFDVVEKEIVDRDFSWDRLGQEDFYKFVKRDSRVKVCKKCQSNNRSEFKNKNDFFTIFGKNYHKFDGLVYGLHNAAHALKNAWRIIESTPVDYHNPAHTGKYAYKEGELVLRMKESSWPLFVHILGFLSMDKELRSKVFEYTPEIEETIKRFVEGFYLIWDMNFVYRDFYRKMLESGGLKVPITTTGYELVGLVVKYFMMELMKYMFEGEKSVLDEPDSLLKIASFIQVREGKVFVRRGPNHFVNIKNEYLLYKARLWTWMFVELFLLDKGDMLEYLDKCDAENEGKLKSHMNQYSKELLKSGLDVFQLCPEFVLALHERYQAHQKMTNGVAFRSNANITAKEFVALRGDRFMYETLDSKVRGSGGYFKKSMLKLTALTAKYGNPNFFVTFSFDEKSWLELTKIIDPSRFISGMPVNIVMHIIKRFGIVNADFLKLYKNEEGLLGKIKSYFIRLEMQERGTLHFHMLLWVDGNEKGVSLIRGNMPNKGLEKLLAHLVKSRQIHVCDDDCIVERQGLKMCRYLYPRKWGVYHVTYNAELDIFDYPCPSMQDIYVVPYISQLLLFNRSGMDIKVFDERSIKEIIKYVTKYLTKKDKKKTTTPEAVVGIIQTKHIRESEEIVSIPCNRDDEIARSLKKQAQIEDMAAKQPNTKDIYYDSKHEIYLARPDVYEDCSYGEYFQQYEYSYKQREKERGVIDRGGRWIYQCKEGKAVMTNLSSTTNLNRQAYFLLKLFQPHRRETDLMAENKIDSESGEEYIDKEVYRYFDRFEWAKHYKTLIWDNQVMKERMMATNVYKYIELLKKIIIHTRNDIENPSMMIEQLDKMYSDKKENIDLSDVKKKLEKFDKLFGKCSEEQKKALSLISIYLEDYFLNRESDYGIAIQGAAGTGKSYVIKLIKKLCKILDLNCEIVAPTGIAALNVGGRTYHSFLSFAKGDVKRATTLEYAKLKLKQEDKFRIMKTDVLIIEEMSMVGSKGLDAINLFMQAAGLEFGVSKLFGGKCVIMFGDFMQLPPVKQEMTYKAQSFSYFTQRFSFQDNQRAREDPMFQYVLEKIRANEIDDDVERILIQRIFNANDVTDKDIIYLYGKRDHVETKNEDMVKGLEGNCQVSVAIESPPFEELVAKYKMPEWEHLYSRKMMAPRKLLLNASCRYVLLRNVNKNFVNGSIVRVLFSEHIDLSQCMEICLAKDPSTSVIIRRHKEWLKFKHEGRKVSMNVKQYPLAPAFAMTIHKVQGMTLDRVAVDLGSDDIFAKHQAYVAISRVRHLKDLFLINYRKKAFMIDSEVVEEIKRFVPAITLQGSEQPSHILGNVNDDEAQVVLDIVRERNLDRIIKMQIPVINNSLEMFCMDPSSFTETDMLLGKQDPVLLEQLKHQIATAKELINKQFQEFSRRNDQQIAEVLRTIRPKRPTDYKYKGKRSRPKPKEQRIGAPSFVKDIYEETLKRKALRVLDHLKKDMQANIVPQIQMKSKDKEIDPWIITQITTPHRVQPFKYFKGKEKANKGDVLDEKDGEDRKKIKVSEIEQLASDLEKFIIQPKVSIQTDIRSFVHQANTPRIIPEAPQSASQELPIASQLPHIVPQHSPIVVPPAVPPNDAVEDREMERIKESYDEMNYEPKIGLLNIGSTCYFNALMQAFAAAGVPTRNRFFNQIIYNLRSGYSVQRDTIQRAVKSISYTNHHYERMMEGEVYPLLNEIFANNIVYYPDFYNDVICTCQGGHLNVESDTHVSIEGNYSVSQFFQSLNQRNCSRENCDKPIITTSFGFAKYLIMLRPIWIFKQGVAIRNENPNPIDNHFTLENKHFLFKAAVCWRGPNNNTGHYYTKVFHNYSFYELSDKNRTQIVLEKFTDWNLAFYEIVG